MPSTSPKDENNEPAPQSRRADVLLRRLVRRLFRAAVEVGTIGAHPLLLSRVPLAVRRRHRARVGDVSVPFTMRLAIVAGEASGDLHASEVVAELKKLDGRL